MKTLIGIVVLGLAVGGLYVLNSVARDKDGQSLLHVAKPIEVPVDMAEPQQRDIVRVVQAPGEVEPFAEVDISAEVVAKILEMPVEEGDSVTQGQLLCRLDDADYRARVLSREANVAKLRAAVAQAEADQEKAQRDCDRQKRLSESNATSNLEMADYYLVLIRARAALEMRKQELIEAEAALQSAREDLAKTVITAPLTGVISQLFAKQGEVVITGTMNNPGTRIMVVSDLSKMQVRCRVDETDAPLVKTDQPAWIYLQSDTRKSVPGNVLRVATKGTKPLGRDVVTFETLVLITGNDPRVRPGMTANVEIEVARQENALTIPLQAVVNRKRNDLPKPLIEEYDRQVAQRGQGVSQNLAEYVKLVFCVEEGKAYPHLVETGISDATRVQVTSGLTPTSKIVVGPYRSLDQLKDGAPVKPAEPPPGTPQPATEAAAEDAAKGDAASRENAPADNAPPAEDAPPAKESAPADGESENAAADSSTPPAGTERTE
ncbi:MAG TPA: efflux RND transporter periplasmic adaptor subunit [Phycisphaerae bacterium]|nr:efflux RND transporter periplasmic adaptor subunit [Phycisphaerae bacterium]HNU45985.1 efflux RND transporter periplasmic adaptor subunit [Phycisphaerae bacterium]